MNNEPSEDPSKHSATEQEVRQALLSAFPGVPFDVHESLDPASITVTYTDGPRFDRVNDFLRHTFRVRIAEKDDVAAYEAACGGNQIFTRRDYSASVYAACRMEICARFRLDLNADDFERIQAHYDKDDDTPYTISTWVETTLSDRDLP